MSARARHPEAAEREEHPLNRIIAVEQREDAVVSPTTDIHCPGASSRQVQRAHNRQLDIDFDETGSSVRAGWRASR